MGDRERGCTVRRARKHAVLVTRGRQGFFSLLELWCRGFCGLFRKCQVVV